MRKTLLSSIYDAFSDYGYTDEEIDEVMHELLVRDEIETDLEHGCCLPALTAQWLQIKKYQYMRDEFSYELIRQGDVGEWASIIKLMVLDCTTKEARRWAEQSIRYVISPAYWRDTTFVYGLSYYLNKAAINSMIPFDVIAEAITAGYNAHYGRDFDNLKEEIRKYVE
ncbi:hypothetical protein NRE35_004375 [Salmonella enterica]|nr:hypothetical protein [Salmonella enterica subsp. enterica serovar Oslo]EEX4841269.1 hypothetical protein [Escherichia coli]EJO2544009.1 hypothetical protein [Salmonella enterica]ELF5188671.1 hypothetical protein [Salmonella enterica]